MNIKDIWEYDIQILPVLLSLLIVEGINVIRKLKKFYYIPIYFPIFPLRELNPKLSYYLGEDYYTGIGESMTQTRLAEIKQEIIRDSIISIFISAIAIPSISGFLFAFYLTKDLLIQSVVIIFVYKLYNIIRAMIDFKYHAVGKRNNLILLGIVYFFYLGVFFQLLFNAFNWAKPFIEIENYRDLLLSLSDLIFNKAILQGLILAGIAAYFANRITDKNIRDENLKRD